MKTRILLLLTFITFLSACESNNTANLNIISTDLIGTWNLKNQTIEDGSLTITTQGQALTANYSAATKDIDFRFIFSENPNNLNLDGKYTLQTTATFLGQKQVEEQEIDTNLSPITSVNWTLNGNTITLTENGSLPTVLNVEEFSANYLKLKGEINETETDNGESATIKGTIYIELVK